jgi:asparagine synthase (glutamine-hydrolysing)
VRRGIHAVLDLDMPIYPKRRFQQGAGAVFTEDEARYRRHFHALHA